MNVWHIKHMFALMLLPIVGHSMGGDDPLLWMMKFHQLEWVETDEGNAFAGEFSAWLGKDYEKLRVQGEFETHDGVLEESELHAFYSWAISPYWDADVGFRVDHPSQRKWLAVGVEGLAPYFLESQVTLYAGSNRQLGAKYHVEAEIQVNNSLVFMPDLEVEAYRKSEPARGISAGINDVHLGLRLGWQVRRDVVPYIGITWQHHFGRADAQHGDEAAGRALVAGVHLWF